MLNFAKNLLIGTALKVALSKRVELAAQVLLLLLEQVDKYDDKQVQRIEAFLLAAFNKAVDIEPDIEKYAALKEFNAWLEFESDAQIKRMKHLKALATKGEQIFN